MSKEISIEIIPGTTTGVAMIEVLALSTVTKVGNTSYFSLVDHLQFYVSRKWVDLHPDQIKNLTAAQIRALLRTATVKHRMNKEVNASVQLPEPEKVEKQIEVEQKAPEHFLTPVVRILLAKKQNVYLVGPAGGGKTTVSEKLAKEMGVQFRFLSVCDQTSKSDILGVLPPSGEYRPSGFRSCWEHGGIYLADELDKGGAGVVAVFNSALAGELCEFPDRQVRKHPNFRFIAGGNTDGNGADAQYVGSQQLDAATLDRFGYLAWPYDYGLTWFLTTGKYRQDKKNILDITGKKVNAEEWTEIVHFLMEEAQRLQLRILITPRAAIAGAKLCADLPLSWMLNIFIRRGTCDDDWKALTKELNQFLVVLGVNQSPTPVVQPTSNRYNEPAYQNPPRPPEKSKRGNNVNLDSLLG
jgi:hypothetical protein